MKKAKANEACSNSIINLDLLLLKWECGRSGTEEIRRNGSLLPLGCVCHRSVDLSLPNCRGFKKSLAFDAIFGSKKVAIKCHPENFQHLSNMLPLHPCLSRADGAGRLLGQVDCIS